GFGATCAFTNLVEPFGNPLSVDAVASLPRNETRFVGAGGRCVHQQLEVAAHVPWSASGARRFATRPVEPFQNLIRVSLAARGHDQPFDHQMARNIPAPVSGPSVAMRATR